MILNVDGQAAPAPALVHLLSDPLAPLRPVQVADSIGPSVHPAIVLGGATASQEAPYMRLGWMAASPEALALCDDLLDRLGAATGSAKIRTVIVQGFAGALIASLRRPAPRPPMYRPWTTASFDATAPTAVQGFGYRPAKETRDALIRLGFLEQAEPHRFGIWVAEPGQERTIRLPDRAATYRASTAFGALAAGYGGPTRCLFKPTLPPWPMVLYPAKKPGAPTSKKPRKPIALPASVKRSPQVTRIVRDMREVNSFLARFELSHGDGSPAFAGLHRIFAIPADQSAAHLDQYGWNLHGRIYAAGDGDGLRPYQSIVSAKRPELLIDGETTAELDIRASWPTIVYGLVGRDLPDFDPDRWAAEERDPYEGIVDLEADRAIPRDVTKAASAIFLTNTGRYFRHWPGQTVADLSDRFPRLQADYPALDVGRALLNARPHLAQWKGANRGHGLTLMHLEAEAIISTMQRAMAAGIPAYPIHDAVIVPESQAETVRTMLVEEFFRAFRARPYVRTKVACD